MKEKFNISFDNTIQRNLSIKIIISGKISDLLNPLAITQIRLLLRILTASVVHRCLPFVQSVHPNVPQASKNIHHGGTENTEKKAAYAINN
jgi:hypothetical protein